MKKRSRLSKKKSKKLFTRTAKNVNSKNVLGHRPMRGGYRL